MPAALSRVEKRFQRAFYGSSNNKNPTAMLNVNVERLGTKPIEAQKHKSLDRRFPRA